MTMTDERPSLTAAIEVTAPAAVPYRYGLFSVAAPQVAADPHGAFGAEWASRGCGQVGTTFDPCITQDEVPALTPNVDCAWFVTDPFTVYAYSTESIPTTTLEGHEQAARDVLSAGEQYGVEQGLWRALTGAGVVPVASAGVVEGLAIVEAMLAAVYGGRGVIHMDRFTATLLGDRLRVEGGSLVTSLGSQVVAGGGYGPELAAVPATATIYGTGPLAVFGTTTEVFTAWDRAVNNASIVASRTFSAGWECAAVATTVTFA